jgi:hypothetical protein
MANLKEVSKVLGVLTLAYPKSELKPGMAEVYSSLLSEIPVSILEAAAKQIMVENTFFPSIAELRNKSLELMSGVKELPLPAEAYNFAINYYPEWHEITGEMTEAGAYVCVTHYYEWVHPLVEQAAKLMGWPDKFPTNNPMADRSQFFKVYESLVNREVEQNKLLPEVKQVSEQYRLEVSNLTHKLEANNG